MFTFLLHDLWAFWSWTSGITTSPFMNCSVSWGLELHSVFYTEHFSYIFSSCFCWENNRITETWFYKLTLEQISINVLSFFFIVRQLFLIRGNFSRKTNLGNPLQLSAPCQAVLPSPSTQHPPISHVQKPVPWTVAWTRSCKLPEWKGLLKMCRKNKKKVGRNYF